MASTTEKKGGLKKRDSQMWDNEDLAMVKIRVLQGHSESVNSCQIVKDTTRIFSASTDCSVRFWDFKTGKCLRTYNELHTANIPNAHCKPDGSQFLTCAWDKKLKLWDSETGHCLMQKSHEDFLTCCRICHQGHLVAAGSDLTKSLRVYDVRSGEKCHEVKNHHGSGITNVKFTPGDDKVITASMDKTIQFYDLISSTTTIRLKAHTNVISSCDITHDERKFASASWDKTILLWDVATGMYRSHGPTVLKGGHDGCVGCCQFSKDGLFLVTGSYDMSIVVWDVENCVQKMKLQGHFSWINDICFSDDQNWLLSCSKDKTVRLWNIEESDKIPIVLENKKAHGVKVMKCTKCGKPFSMTQLESFRDVTVCVFCRLASPEKSWLTFTDSPEPSHSSISKKID